MVAFLPLFIDFSGRRVVVFGGGAVGERKARYFLSADVVVVSRKFTGGLEAMGSDGAVRLVHRDVRNEDVRALIGDAFLVVAATSDPALNGEIGRIAGESGVMVNSATGGSPVIVPSVLERGRVMIAISTGGLSPALSKYVRLKLEQSLGEDLDKMAELQDRIKERLKKTETGQKEREKILWAVLEDDDVWEALDRSSEAALELAMKKVDNIRRI